MPYNIILSDQKEFSVSPGGTPLVNEWVFNPPSIIKINHVLGDPIPLPVIIDTYIKNYLSFESSDKIIVRVRNITSNNTPWAVLSGPIVDETPEAPIGVLDKSGYLLAENNLHVTNTVTFQNIQGLTSGKYWGLIDFQIYDVSDANLEPVFIDQIDISYLLTVSKTPILSVTPSSLVYSMLRGDELPSAQSLNITAPGSWVATVDKKVTLSEASAIDNSTPTQTIISGVGNKTVSVGLSSDIDSISGNIYNTAVIIKNNDGFEIAISLKVMIFEEDIFLFNSTQLIFNAVKGYAEAKPQSFEVSGFGAFTIKSPSWLSIDLTSGTHTGVFIATPISANNLSSGKYEDNIIVSSGNKDHKLPVTYIIEGIVSTELDGGDFNFSRDLQYLNIRNGNRDIDNIVKLILTIKVYDYISHKLKEIVLPSIIPFFEYGAALHIGEITERLFKKPYTLKAFDYENLIASPSQFFEVYKPASVNANIKIIKRSTATTIEEHNLLDMKFISGKKPSTFLNNRCLLSNNNFTKRVTKTSREILSFLVPFGGYTVTIKKNTTVSKIVSTQSTGSANIIRYAFNFSEFEPGDLIVVEIISGNKSYKKSYQLIPEGDYSNHIAFVNQFKVLELIEFTGGYNVNSNISHIKHTYYKNMVEVIESLRSDKSATFHINTGAIFKTDQITIDELLRAKKAWLLFKDKPAIELIPKDKKLTNFDSDQELYDFEVEFDINRSHDAENYSF